MYCSLLTSKKSNLFKGHVNFWVKHIASIGLPSVLQYIQYVILMVWPEDAALWWAWGDAAVWRGQGGALWGDGAAWRGQGGALWAEGALSGEGAVWRGQGCAAPVGDTRGEVTSSRAEVQRPAHPGGGRVDLGSDPHPQGDHQAWEQPQHGTLEVGGGRQTMFFPE